MEGTLRRRRALWRQDRHRENLAVLVVLRERWRAVRVSLEQAIAILAGGFAADRSQFLVTDLDRDVRCGFRLCCQPGFVGAPANRRR
jgi:hypothetical protein